MNRTDFGTLPRQTKSSFMNTRHGSGYTTEDSRIVAMAARIAELEAVPRKPPKDRQK